MSYTKQYKKSRRKNPHKVGKHKSHYCLFVVFLPIYQYNRKDFRYYSDDRNGIEKGLERLKRRVLYGTCKGKYSRAILYEVPGNSFVAAYLPNHGEVDYETYCNIRKKEISNSKYPPLLKVYILLYPTYIDELTSNGKRHPIILDSVDYDLERGTYGVDVGTHSLLQMLKSEALRNKFKIALIYRQSDNRKVALITAGMNILFKCPQFKKAIQNSKHYLLY